MILERGRIWLYFILYYFQCGSLQFFLARHYYYICDYNCCYNTGLGVKVDGALGKLIHERKISVVNLQ